MVEPEFFSITVSSWSNILVALTTLVLAFITWYSIGQMRKQLALLKKQTLLTFANQGPLLQVEKYSFKGNVLSLKIKNIGAGSAHKIGVHTRFHFAEPIPRGIDKNTGLTMGTFSYAPGHIVDDFENENRKVGGGEAITFISKSIGKVIILNPNQSTEVSLEPNFFLKTGTKNSPGRFVDFPEFHRLLKKNGKKFVGIAFELECKNIVEDIQDSVEITKFVFDVNGQKNLEEGEVCHYSFDFEALSQDAMEMNMGVMDYPMYKGLKSRKNYFPDDDLFEKDKDDF